MMQGIQCSLLYECGYCVSPLASENGSQLMQSIRKAFVDVSTECFTLVQMTTVGSIHLKRWQK